MRLQSLLKIALLGIIATQLTTVPAQAASQISISEKSIQVPIYGSAQSSYGKSLRIVSLANGGAEVIVALGLKSKLVGRDIASTFTGDAKIPIVTQAHAVSAEKVLSVRPTLILVNPGTGPLSALKQIKSAGVKIVNIPEVYSVDGMQAKYLAIITALKISKTDPVAQKLLNSIPLPETSTTTASQKPTVAFLYLRGTSGIYLLGGKGSGADALIESAGGTDIGAQTQKTPFVPLTPEALVAMNPSIILLMQKGLESVGGLTGLLALPGLSQTQAGKTQKVITVDDSLLLAFGPRTGELINKLSLAIKALQ